jgi:hypothetical protein
MAGIFLLAGGMWRRSLSEFLFFWFCFWEECELNKEISYIYKLILAIDANFKMKNRIRVNERYDPSLGPGWGAFVEPTGYRSHLKKYIAEKDVGWKTRCPSSRSTLTVMCRLAHVSRSPR